MKHKPVITHAEYTQNYYEGYDTCVNNIKKVGWEKSRDLLNEKFPVGQRIEGMDNYYFAKGYMDALLNSK